MSRTLTFAGVEYHVPFADLIRAHTDKERAALAASIAEVGVLVPVVTYDRMADAGGGLAVLEGATRLTIASEAGLESVPVEHLGALSDDHARALCLTLNADRRQLSIADQQAARKQRVVLAVELKEAGLSTRQIAKGLGVSQKQVQRDLTSPTATGITSDNSESGDSPPDPDLKQLNATISAVRRAKSMLDELLKTKFAKRANQLLANHNAECGLESVGAALADLSVEAVQWDDTAE